MAARVKIFFLTHISGNKSIFWLEQRFALRSNMQIIRFVCVVLCNDFKHFLQAFFTNVIRREKLS